MRSVMTSSISYLIPHWNMESIVLDLLLNLFLTKRHSNFHVVSSQISNEKFVHFQLIKLIQIIYVHFITLIEITAVRKIC